MKFLSIKDYKSKKEVLEEYPNRIVVKVDGGWGIFETRPDYEMWKKQK